MTGAFISQNFIKYKIISKVTKTLPFRYLAGSHPDLFQVISMAFSGSLRQMETSLALSCSMWQAWEQKARHTPGEAPRCTAGRKTCLFAFFSTLQQKSCRIVAARAAQHTLNSNSGRSTWPKDSCQGLPCKLDPETGPLKSRREKNYTVLTGYKCKRATGICIWGGQVPTRLLGKVLLTVEDLDMPRGWAAPSGLRDHRKGGRRGVHWLLNTQCWLTTSMCQKACWGIVFNISEQLFYKK